MVQAGRHQRLAVRSEGQRADRIRVAHQRRGTLAGGRPQIQIAVGHADGDPVAVRAHRHAIWNIDCAHSPEKCAARHAPELEELVLPGGDEGLAVRREAQACQEDLVSKGARGTCGAARAARRFGKHIGRPRREQPDQGAACEYPAVGSALAGIDPGSLPSGLRRQGEVRKTVLKSFAHGLPIPQFRGAGQGAPNEPIGSYTT